MSGARPWLPPGTCFGRLDRHIADTVREWSNAWFGDDAEVAAGIAMREGILAGAKPHLCAPGLWLILPDGMVRAMGRLALQVEYRAHETPPDRITFDAVGTDCFAALQEALTRALSAEAVDGARANEATKATGTVWKVDFKRAAVRFGVVLSDAVRIELLLKLLPPAPARPSLSLFGGALAPLEVQLAASLGTCGITLAELRSLSAGDVLVLERDLAGASPLAINGILVRGGACTVSREADSLLLEISESITGTTT